jgi:predicted DNA-binding transcriptional regulator AlpA
MRTPAPLEKTAPVTHLADDDALLTGKQTRARVGGVSDMCIWRWMRDERVQFPHPIQINRRNYWRLGDLRQWQAERTVKVS